MRLIFAGARKTDAIDASSWRGGSRRRLRRRMPQRERSVEMGPSYDAQRNEFCAYVLHESQTPYGLLLGNYQNLRAIDRQGRRARALGRRYRSNHFRNASHRLPLARERGNELHALSASDRARADVSSLRADLRVHAAQSHSRHRIVLRAARPGVRARRLFRRRRHAL